MLETKIINSRNHQMVTVIEYKDEATKGDNVLLFCHGFVGHKITPHRMAVNLSRRLIEMGVTVVRFDYVGAGDSQGDNRYMTINGEVEDTMHVVDYVKENFKCNKLFVLGYSMGGTVASLTSAKIKPDGLFLWSPVSNPYWNFYHLLGSEKFLAGIQGNDVDIDGDLVGKEFFEGINKINPVQELEGFDRPVRIVHGTKDEDVLPINSYNYKNAIKDVKIHFVNDSDHCYSSLKFQQELLDATVEFIKELL